MLTLIKKDLLLIKKQVGIMFVISIIIPLFVAFQLPENLGSIAFIYMVVFTSLITLQAIAVEEAKFPKASALLCSVPYSRNTLVKAKYLFFLILFAYCCVVHAIMALILPSILPASFHMILIVLLGGNLLYGTFLPLYYKYGFEKTKLFFMFSIFVISFGVPLLINYFQKAGIKIGSFQGIPVLFKNILLALASILALGISMMISTKIFEKKDL